VTTTQTTARTRSTLRSRVAVQIDGGRSGLPASGGQGVAVIIVSESSAEVTLRVRTERYAPLRSRCSAAHNDTLRYADARPISVHTEVLPAGGALHRRYRARCPRRAGTPSRWPGTRIAAAGRGRVSHSAGLPQGATTRQVRGRATDAMYRFG
jgi:hypothetical protein